MPEITMKELLEAGVHFGHQTKRWNPKMKKFLFGERNGIYIIDLQKTIERFKEACDFVKNVSERGDSVLFVGTKRQAAETITEEAERCGMLYVTHRWLGGTLTNFQTIRKSVNRLKQLEQMQKDGSLESLPKKEALQLSREIVKLNRTLVGIKDMDRLPAAVVVVDTKRERIAVREAQRLAIPVVALVDTNCDPDEIVYPIPGNDDAIRAIKLIVTRLADAVQEGRGAADRALEEELLARAEQGPAADAGEEEEEDAPAGEAEELETLYEADR
jgi:small subunit ribosomal protein S2